MILTGPLGGVFNHLLSSSPRGRRCLARNPSPSLAARHGACPAELARRKPLSCAPFPALGELRPLPFLPTGAMAPHPGRHLGLTRAAPPRLAPPPRSPDPACHSIRARPWGAGPRRHHSQSAREVRWRRGQSAFRLFVGAAAAVGASLSAAGPACRCRSCRCRCCRCRSCRCRSCRSCRGSSRSLALALPRSHWGWAPALPSACPALPARAHSSSGWWGAGRGGSRWGRVLAPGSGRRPWAAEGTGRAPGKAAGEGKGSRPRRMGGERLGGSGACVSVSRVARRCPAAGTRGERVGMASCPCACSGLSLAPWSTSDLLPPWHWRQPLPRFLGCGCRESPSCFSPFWWCWSVPGAGLGQHRKHCRAEVS